MKATKLQLNRCGLTEFVVEADEDEATADAIVAQVYDAIGNPGRRVQVQITLEPGVGWRVRVLRYHVGESARDPFGAVLEARFRQLDRRGRPDPGPP
jgi:hypothetical protein